VAEFPHFEGVQAGCNGLLDCWKTPETQWRDVSSNLEQNLEAQGYEVKPLDLEDDTGRRVYEVSKEGEIKYYLNVLSTQRGTVYKISREPLTREELNQAAAL
jgi:N-dimethylarginine dimethylaminohydrolase